MGSVRREVQDLDKPIRDLAKENRISFDFKIDLHLSSNIKLLQKGEELTIIYRIGPLRIHKKEIIISPNLMIIGKVIIPFYEMQYVGPLQHTKSSDSWSRKTYYTLVLASNSDAFDMIGLSCDQVSRLGRLILAGACGKLKSPIYAEQHTFDQHS